MQCFIVIVKMGVEHSYGEEPQVRQPLEQTLWRSVPYLGHLHTSTALGYIQYSTVSGAPAHQHSTGLHTVQHRSWGTCTLAQHWVTYSTVPYLRHLYTNKALDYLQ
jgi:hypothetical protein